jgi:hypothetical protein
LCVGLQGPRWSPTHKTVGAESEQKDRIYFTIYTLVNRGLGFRGHAQKKIKRSHSN